MLDDMSLDFEIYVNDATFDNDDNPYGKIMFHNYINMDGPLDKGNAEKENAEINSSATWWGEVIKENTGRDEIIPLGLCKKKVTAIW